MKPDTGESSSSINARRDDEEMDRVIKALRHGATLCRPPKLDRFYVCRGVNDYGGGSLSKSRVRKLETQGVLVHVGVDRYALGEE